MDISTVALSGTDDDIDDCGGDDDADEDTGDDDDDADDDDADDADVGVVCSVRNASILIECTGSAKWGGNSAEEENDAIMITTTISLWVLKKSPS